MNISAKSVLVIAFVAVVALFVLFSGGMLSGSMLSGGFMGGGMTLAPARSAGVGGGVTGGIS